MSPKVNALGEHVYCLSLPEVALLLLVVEEMLDPEKYPAMSDETRTRLQRLSAKLCEE